MARHTGIDKDVVFRALKALDERAIIQSGARGWRLKTREQMIVPAEIDDAGLTPREFRLLFHVIRRESTLTACFSSLNKIAQVTRITQVYVKKGLASLIDKGMVVRDAHGHLSSKFRKQLPAPAANAELDPILPSPVGSTSQSSQQPVGRMCEPIDEEDFDELTRPKLPFSAVADGDLLLYKVHSIPAAACDPGESHGDWCLRLLATQYTHFAEFDEAMARTGAILYTWRCFAAEHPLLFGQLLGDRDVKLISGLPYQDHVVMLLILEGRLVIERNKCSSKWKRFCGQHVRLYQWAGRAINAVQGMVNTWCRLDHESFLAAQRQLNTVQMRAFGTRAVDPEDSEANYAEYRRATARYPVAEWDHISVPVRMDYEAKMLKKHRAEQEAMKAIIRERERDEMRREFESRRQTAAMLASLNGVRPRPPLQRPHPPVRRPSAQQAIGQPVSPSAIPALPEPHPPATPENAADL